MATVSYIADLEWQFEGVRFPDKLRVLDVYVKEKGHWNQTASNVTTHPEASEAGRQQPQALTPSQRQQLLADREKVWRAYFATKRERQRNKLFSSHVTFIAKRIYDSFSNELKVRAAS